MSFVARYPGGCAFCGEQMQGTDVVYAEAKVLTHTGCLVPYSTGVDPVAVAAHRNEKRCTECFMTHAGECL